MTDREVVIGKHSISTASGCSLVMIRADFVWADRADFISAGLDKANILCHFMIHRSSFKAMAPGAHIELHGGRHDGRSVPLLFPYDPIRSFWDHDGTIIVHEDRPVAIRVGHLRGIDGELRVDLIHADAPAPCRCGWSWDGDFDCDFCNGGRYFVGFDECELEEWEEPHEPIPTVVQLPAPQVPAPSARAHQMAQQMQQMQQMRQMQQGQMQQMQQGQMQQMSQNQLREHERKRAQSAAAWASRYGQLPDGLKL